MARYTKQQIETAGMNGELISRGEEITDAPAAETWCATCQQWHDNSGHTARFRRAAVKEVA